MFVSVPEKSQKDPVSHEELRSITPLSVLGLLHKVGWALGNESADIHYHPLLRSIVLTTIFCISWYKVVKQRSLVVYHEVSHLSLVFT